MLKGFKDFVMRGNVVDLAVGVVIGVAFAGVVESFTASFLKPLINLVGGADIKGVIELPGDQQITWGAFLSVLIGFVITAAVVYFLVIVPMNRLAQMGKRNQTPEPEITSEEIVLLREIRDALLAPGVSEAVRQRTTR